MARIGLDRCPVCGSEVIRCDVRPAPIVGGLELTLVPCGHLVWRIGGDACDCRTTVSRITPEQLEQWNEDADKSHDSARALGIAITVGLLAACLAVIYLTCVAICL
jgi:hypothetical protein